ncbi:MAG TPA: polysaccharide deacetylase family protein [Candidatus Paceibacterota bacterium]|nr:polysaccharide deacetylase family protein [Candidatus Paceibacterota bacterium]
MSPRTRARYGIISIALALASTLLLISASPQRAAAAALGPNLIQNPSLEAAQTGGLPAHWHRGGYGTNIRTLAYPAAPAHSGSDAASVSITSYGNGDAKWYPDQVAVQGGASYRFSDFYTGTVPSEVDVQVTHANGSITYIVLGKPAASRGGYAQFAATFTAPLDARSVTIFHVIAQVGSLTVDDYSLQQVTATDTGLIRNGGFEQAGSDGLPLHWHKGSWGSNSAAFAYPVPGAGSAGSGARVTVSGYGSGDAKWYFDPISLAPGIYTYSDQYAATVPSYLTVQLHHSNGTYTYEDIGVLPAASGYTRASADFVVTSDVVDVTVFHLIKQNGDLRIDNASIVKNQASGIFQNGAVTLTFDNGWLSHYTVVTPKLKSLGLTGTFYIITHEIADNGYPGFVSKAQIKQMYADGMEIGSHTQTHPHLTQLSAAQQKQEIDGSKQDLLALGVGAVDSFAYPFGEYDTTSTSLVEAEYGNARSTNTGYATPDADRYHLPRLVVLNSTTPAQIESWIDEAAKDHVWLIIEFHQVDTSGEQYAITPSDFNTVADYLKQKGIPVVSITDGAKSLQ